MPRVVNTAAQIAKLQKQLALLQKKEAGARDAKKNKALTKIMQLARDGGVSAADIAQAFKAGPGAKKDKARLPTRKSTKSASTGAKVAPKYRNPGNPEQTWTGRGKSPLWVAALRAEGKLDEALIK